MKRQLVFKDLASLMQTCRDLFSFCREQVSLRNVCYQVLQSQDNKITKQRKFYEWQQLNRLLVRRGVSMRRLTVDGDLNPFHHVWTPEEAGCLDHRDLSEIIYWIRKATHLRSLS